MTFSYVRLALDEIRLLTLRAGSANSAIKCKLRNVSLGDYSVHREGIYRWSGGGVHWIRPIPEGTDDVPNGLEWPFEAGPKSVRRVIDEELLPKFYGPSPNLDGLPLVPEYEALSYAWGDHSQLRTIEVNDSEFEVTSNLHAALNRLRLSNSDRVLWIDAICIDQTNLDERADQVSKMRQIYQRAQHVLVWLGKESEDSALAMRLLERLGGGREHTDGLESEFGEWYGPQYEFMKGYGDPARKLNEERIIHGLSKLALLSPAEVGEAGWTAIDRLLLGRNYWERVWIIQEVTYARGITVYCGQDTLDWSVFKYLPMRKDWPNYPQEARRLRETTLASGLVRLLSSRQNSREPSRSLGFEKESSTLLNWLTNFWDCGSTDPRDKVYALLGLPSIDYDMVLPKVNYKDEVATIYGQIALAIMEQERTLDVLCLPHPDLEDNRHGLPSWVPDWTTKPTTAPILDVYSGLRRSYKASGDSVPRGPSFHHGKTNRFVEEWSDAPKLEMELIEAPRNESTPALRQFSGQGELAFQDATQSPGARKSSGTGYILRGSARFGVHGGLLTRSFEENQGTLMTFDPKLSVNGVNCGTVITDCPAIPLEAFKSNDWEGYLRQWEDIFNYEDLFTADDPGTLPPHADFLWTIFKGEIANMPRNPEVPWRHVLYENYLVWSGRKDISTATWAHLFSQLRDIGDTLKAKIPGWKFAMMNMGMMSMVPSRTKEGDIIVVLFGADTPLVLRPVERDRNEYRLLGAAYVHGIMYGNVVEGLKNGEGTEETFVLV